MAGGLSDTWRLAVGGGLALAAAGLGFWMGRATGRSVPSPAVQPGPVIAAPKGGPALEAKPGSPRQRAPSTSTDPAEQRIADIRRQMNQTRNPIQRFHLELDVVQARFEGGDVDKALQEADAIRTDLKRPEEQWKRAHSLLLELLHRSQRRKQRLTALSLRPREDLTRRDVFLLAAMQGLEGQQADQIETLRYIRKQTPEDDHVPFILFSVLQRAGRLEEAAAELARMRTYAPATFPVRAYDMARAYRKEGLTDKVEMLAVQVEELAMTGELAAQRWSIASRLYSLAGDVENAERALENWANATGSPRDKERARVRKIEVLLEAGRKAEAARKLPGVEKGLQVKENIAFARSLRKRLGLPLQVAP